MLGLFRPSPFLIGEHRPGERLLRRLRFRDSYRRLSLALAPDSAQTKLIESLEREGTAMLEGYIPADRLARMQADLQSSLEQLEFEMPCLAQSRIEPMRHQALLDDFLLGTPEQHLHAGIAFSRDEATSLDQVVRDFNPSTLTAYMLERSAAFRETWLDPWLLGIVAHYLGLLPRLAEAYVRRNFPARFRTMNHFWHRDLNDRHQLVKMFIFLSDCSVDNGPHEFIRRSHREFDLLNGRRYYPDEEIDAAHPVGSPHRLVSEVKAGTIIIEDTRGLHRAQMPNEGYRDLGYAVFLPLPTDAEPRYFEFPRSAYESLSPFQQAFLAPATAR